MISYAAEILGRRPWVTKYDIGIPPEVNFPDFPAHEMLRIGANLDPEKAATWFTALKSVFGIFACR